MRRFIKFKADKSVPSKLRIDTVLQRTAWVGQITLFIVAIVGYFVTVRPIYQKQILDEQIAETKVKLRNATLRLESVESEEKKLRKEYQKLNNEAGANYLLLRRSLHLKLLTGSSCVYKTNLENLNGTKLYECLKQYAKDEVIEFLKPSDQQRVIRQLEIHKNQIINFPTELEKSNTVKIIKAKKRVNQLKSKINNLDKSIIEMFRYSRRSDKDAETPINSLKDITELKTAEEVNAYNKYREEVLDASLELISAEWSLNDSSASLRVELDSKLREILRKVVDELSK